MIPAELSDISLPEGTWLKEGTYQLKQPIYWGSTSILYLAKSQNEERDLVIKELFPYPCVNRDMDHKTMICNRSEYQSLVDKYKKSFETEGLIVKKICDRNLFLCYVDDFYENGTKYLVFYYINGRQYKNFLDNATKNKEEKLIYSCLAQCVSAVRYLHKQGILHRDLKPSNVLITEEGRPVIIDFGNACLTKEPVNCVSRKFCAPELVRGKPGTRTADCYSLGMLIQLSLQVLEADDCLLTFLSRWMLSKIPLLRFRFLYLLQKVLQIKGQKKLERKE